MTDQSPKPEEAGATASPPPSPPLPSPASPTIEPAAVPPPPTTSRRRFWIIAGISVGVLGVCAVLCIALLAAGVGRVIVEKPVLERVLDGFMRDMAAKDTHGAYALFSPRAQRQMKTTDLDQLLEGNNYILFEGYRSLTIDNLQLKVIANPDPNMPQGTVAEVSGTTSYDDGFTGSLTAVLEKVDGVWRLFNFNVVVPPDKFGS